MFLKYVILTTVKYIYIIDEDEDGNKKQISNKIKFK